MDAMQKQAQEPKQPKPAKVIDLGFITRSGGWLLKEAIMPALEKIIPQGAAELAQALFTQNAYVPYGPTEKPVGEIEVEEQGKQQERGGNAWRTNADLPAPEIRGREIEH